MKQSLQRIAAWARKHPWLAALIVAAVILLGYLVYKRSGGGGAGEDTSVALPEGMEQASPIPSMGDIPSSVSTGGSGSIPSSDVGVSTTTGANTAPSPVGLPSIPPAIPVNFGGLSSGWSPPLDAAIVNTITASKSAATAGQLMSSAQSKKLAPATSGDTRLMSSAKSSKKKSSGKQTPAQQYGKGRNFTGFIPGVGWFQKGFPAAFNAVALESPIAEFKAHPQTVVMPGGTSAIIPAGVH